MTRYIAKDMPLNNVHYKTPRPPVAHEELSGHGVPKSVSARLVRWSFLRTGRGVIWLVGFTFVSIYGFYLTQWLQTPKPGHIVVPPAIETKPEAPKTASTPTPTTFIDINFRPKNSASTPQPPAFDLHANRTKTERSRDGRGIVPDIPEGPLGIGNADPPSSKPQIRKALGVLIIDRHGVVDVAAMATVQQAIRALSDDAIEGLSLSDSLDSQDVLGLQQGDPSGILSKVKSHAIAVVGVCSSTSTSPPGTAGMISVENELSVYALDMSSRSVVSVMQLRGRGAGFSTDTARQKAMASIATDLDDHADSLRKAVLSKEVR